MRDDFAHGMIPENMVYSCRNCRIGAASIYSHCLWPKNEQTDYKQKYLLLDFQIMLIAHSIARAPHSAALEKLETTLATVRGSCGLNVGFTPARQSRSGIGAFVLQKDCTRLQVNVGVEPDDRMALRLKLHRMDTYDPKVQKQGLGSALLGIMFDIAEASDIGRIDVTCEDNGRYAHAANHARVMPEDWPELRQKLQQVLSVHFQRQSATRSIDLDNIAAAVSHCDGKLGIVADAARNAALDGTPFGPRLFLDHRIKTYHACWLPDDRQAFRARQQARNGIADFHSDRSLEILPSRLPEPSPMRRAQQRPLFALTINAR